MSVPARPGCTRRVLLGAALAGLAAPAFAQGDDGLAEATARGKKAGLKEFGRSETAHYLGVGDAPAAFRLEAIKQSESMAASFVDHFKQRGFPSMALPKGKLGAVVLADAKSYARFTGEDEGLAVGGHYDLEGNYLVMFDFRANRGDLLGSAELINTFTLIHETTHQLTFNTGLLDRRGDVPRCVSEGLATYGEVWRPRRNGRVGDRNVPRLEGLRLAREKGDEWIPIRKLIEDDATVNAEGTRDRAYAESWVFAHFHLKTAARLPKLRAYLAAIAPRRDASHRIEDAATHLGDLDKLDADLKRYAAREMG